MPNVRTLGEHKIKMADQFVFQHDSLAEFCNFVFPDLPAHSDDAEWLTSRARQNNGDTFTIPLPGGISQYPLPVRHAATQVGPGGEGADHAAAEYGPVQWALQCNQICHPSPQ